MLTHKQFLPEAMQLDPYFERINYRGRPKADLETLTKLHLLHPLAIPFENLDTLLVEPVQLTDDALTDKLLLRRRGGYCFEQNSLFQTVLETIGFSILPVAARVVWNQDRGYINPRTHMALLVDVEDERFLCDVGFGGATLTAPLRFTAGEVQATPHEPFRIAADRDLFIVEVLYGNKWRAAYEFDLQPQQAVDYEAMNHYVHSHPDSHFRNVLMAARPLMEGRLSLQDNRLTRYFAGAVAETRLLRTADELAQVLTDEIQIRLPDHPGLPPLLERIAGRNPE
jgi:N-hydroxyarylamine O-acetyltransferase